MGFVIVNVVVVDVSLPRTRSFDDSINIICKFLTLLYKDKVVEHFLHLSAFFVELYIMYRSRPTFYFFGYSYSDFLCYKCSHLAEYPMVLAKTNVRISLYSFF